MDSKPVTGKSAVRSQRTLTSTAHWVVLAFALLVVIVSTMPRSTTVPLDDDFDYIHDLLHLRFATFVFKPNAGAQFTPVHKAVYGALLLAFDFNNVPLQWVAMAVRLAMVALFIALLRANDVFSLGGALLCIAGAMASVGLKGVFYWPIELSEELALLALPAALLFLTGRSAAVSYARIAGAIVSLIVGALSFGAGLVSPIAIALAYTIVSMRERSIQQTARVLAAMWATSCAIVALYYWGAANHFAVHGSTIAGAPSHAREVFRFFFYSGIVNGAASGLLPGALPGYAHVVFYGGLVAASVWLLVSDESIGVKVMVLSLLFTHLGFVTLLSLTKWHTGIFYAASFRYIYPNVPLELGVSSVLLGVFVRRMSERHPHYVRVSVNAVAAIGAAVFIVAAVGARRGLEAHLHFEQGRRDCLQRVLRQSGAECLRYLYYANDAEFVRRVWAEMHTKPLR